MIPDKRDGHRCVLPSFFFTQKVLLNAPRNELFDQQILSLATLETPLAKHGYTPGDYGIRESNEGLHIWQGNITGTN